MSTELPEQPQAPQVPAGESVGQQLKARREAMGWSAEQVADQIKLQPRQVLALEEGDYAALPPAAVVRGFVRAYAKVVKTDAAPLVAQIPLDAATAAADASAVMRRRETRGASFSEVRFPTHGKRSAFPLGLTAAVILIIVAIGAAWQLGWIPVQSAQPSVATATPAAPASSAPPVAATPGNVIEPVAQPAVPLISQPGVAVPGAPVQGVAPSTVPTPAPAGAVTQAPAPTSAQTPAQTTGLMPAQTPGQPPAPTSALKPAQTTVQMPAAPANAPQPAKATNAPAVPALKPQAEAAAAAPSANALVLNVKAESWIEVRTEKGKVLFSRLVKPGATETVDVTEPATLTVGNPAGVDATLRGSALALPARKGTTVARVPLK